jgi:hypothetical protein
MSYINFGIFTMGGADAAHVKQASGVRLLFGASGIIWEHPASLAFET